MQTPGQFASAIRNRLNRHDADPVLSVALMIKRRDDEARAEALKDAAERADQAMYDLNLDHDERSYIEKAILADEPKKGG